MNEPEPQEISVEDNDHQRNKSVLSQNDEASQDDQGKKTETDKSVDISLES